MSNPWIWQTQGYQQMEQTPEHIGFLNWFEENYRRDMEISGFNPEKMASLRELMRRAYKAGYEAGKE